MRASELFFSILPDQPGEAATPGYGYLLRGSFVRPMSPGMYVYPPLGSRVIDRLASTSADAIEAAGIEFAIIPSAAGISDLTWESAIRDVGHLVSAMLESEDRLPVHVYMSRPLTRTDFVPGPMSARQFNSLNGVSFLPDRTAAETFADEIAGVMCDIHSSWDLPSLAEGVWEIDAESETGLSEGDSAIVVPVAAGNRDFLWCGECWYGCYPGIKGLREGDKCPDCEGTLQGKRGIEIARISVLGRSLSELAEARGHADAPGVVAWRLDLAASLGVLAELMVAGTGIESFIWPTRVSPFDVHALVLDVEDDTQRRVGESVQAALASAGQEVLLDDRDMLAQQKSREAEFIGIPVQVLIGDQTHLGQVEIRDRRIGEQWLVEIEALAEKLRDMRLPML